MLCKHTNSARTHTNQSFTILNHDSQHLEPNKSQTTFWDTNPQQGCATPCQNEKCVFGPW